jgi:hypothetical protein
LVRRVRTVRVSVVKEEIKKPGPNPVPANKIKPLIEGIGASRLGLYPGWCGWALARAHAKSSDAAMISGHLGSNDRFDTAVDCFGQTSVNDYEEGGKNLKMKNLQFTPPLLLGAAAMFGIAVTSSLAQELPEKLPTKADLAKDNKLFAELATKYLHWDYPNFTSRVRQSGWVAQKQ